MKVYYKDLGPILKKRMEEKHYTIRELSDRLNIPKSTLSDFLNGRAYKGYIETLEKLAIPLDLPTLKSIF